jgi:hypothetical protein
MRIVAAAVLLAAAAPVFAHHSFSLDYDNSKPITLSAKISKVEWRNPHAFLYVEAKEENWAIELGSINSLTRLGWTQNTMAVGDAVKVEGILALEGRRMILARSVVLLRTRQRFRTSEAEIP